MTVFKYKYSIRFLNNEGEWQEKDVAKTSEEAEAIADSLRNSQRTVQIVDLEKESQEDGYY